MAFSTPDDASMTDSLNYLGVELPHGWGNVLHGGAGSFGAATVAN
jgi:hypothetical protein